MKKILFTLMACMACFWSANAQQIDIELWGENSPISYQCHAEGDAGSYGKLTVDHTLEFWNTDNGGIDMRWTYDQTYSKGNPRSGEFIYHGKREGNKIVFTTYEDPYGFNSDEGEMEIDRAYGPYEIEILSPKQLKWDNCVYNKMKMNFTTGKWVRE